MSKERGGDGRMWKDGWDLRVGGGGGNEICFLQPEAPSLWIVVTPGKPGH